jgi:hypothetical protein
MRTARHCFVAVGLMASGVGLAAAPAHAAAAGALTRAGTVTLAGLRSVEGADGLAKKELGPRSGGEGDAPASPTTGGAKIDASRVAAAGTEVTTKFAGITHRNQRLASGANQFSLEPPDQALCVGGNYVVEAVNDALRVFDKSGAPLTGTIALNEFYSYPPAIDRTTGVFGPTPTDPICHYDTDTGRFIVVILTIDNTPAGDTAGPNRLDIAVSQTSNPLGAWTRYKLATQDDGTEGTPNHHCDLGPCLGDYPHIGADKNGIYLTTNEYSLFGDGYIGSQIYALSKADLVGGVASPRIVHIESPVLGPFRSFTVWPAISPAGKAAAANNGTEYFLSTTLGDGSETGNFAPSENRIGAWALTNTASLNTASPNVKLTNRLIEAKPYALPPKATQKDGPTPLRDCINDTAIVTPFGTGCWNLFFDVEPAHNEALAKLDALDTRMQQVVYADGAVWGSFGTAVSVEGRNGKTASRAGIEWVNVSTTFDSGNFRPEVKQSGYVGIADGDVTMPALGLTSSGKPVVGVTVTGDALYPSTGYVQLGNEKPTVKIISAGVGPVDGFSGYNAFAKPSYRWGDYGAAAMDGDTLWVANEYIAQSCTLQQYLTGALGSCAGTRTAFANWATSVSALKL